MADQGEHYEKSWILHHILDTMIGSRGIVDIRRKMYLMEEKVKHPEASIVMFHAGSRGEGFLMTGSDADLMFVDRRIKVLCSNQDTNIPSDYGNMTIAIMRKADCRPSYVTLELLQGGQSVGSAARESIVTVRDRLFISSTIYTKSHQEMFTAKNISNVEIHGPSSSLKNEGSCFGYDVDFAHSYSCADWPPEANEWLSRPRQHGWPDKELIFNISQSGCHVVPVGDKTSADTFLQWRISFVTAERKLIHSLSHEQFLVYGLLKYFLKQISGMLKQMLGDVDILSSYIMKTVIFFAVESTPQSLWKEQHTFQCFMLCLKILISWVNAGYCPNYFIVNNNMFQGKLNGGNQDKLLRFLIEMYNMKWMCLSVGTFIQPSIGVRFQRVMNRGWENISISQERLECERDMTTFEGIFTTNSVELSRSLAILSKSQSETDDSISYLFAVKALSNVGLQTFGQQHAERGNKQRYTSLRKCKNLMTPFASACVSPGLLTLATFYYQTGNYMKALMACGAMLSSFKLFLEHHSNTDKDNYQRLYCGRRYTLLQKCQEVVISCVLTRKDASSFWPSQLHEELRKSLLHLIIPPRPYAIFLTFLCYHELGDRRRRDTALTQLRTVKYDEQQGGSIYWLVNNLLGICYEMVEDPRRAIREYQESVSGRNALQHCNPAQEKIARLQQSLGEPL